MKAHLEYMDTWTSMDIYGLDTHGPMDSHGHPWKLMESHRNPLNSTELSGDQWQVYTFPVLLYKTYGGTSSLGIPWNRSGLMPKSNNTKYPGCSYEAIAIYSKEFHKELME